MIRHEFNHGEEPEVLTTIGMACENEEHSRCAGITIDEDGEIYCCTCFCHRIKGEQK